ncbi:Ribosomal large subunit pseudouridine synthase D [Candidatus Protochlamydia naegleriophila]|uniref:Pseudouridine synthase n=2 Tax=Candidatus Protochlamydia naegleriophila TaxID=389348 RepID=A0A0U5EPS5_9BACT|nr:Ribosomal large subunit pseudouridine synthase D [Candidatus Protochlamydia naegleriophila]
MNTEADDVDSLIITEEEAGERLDKVLARRFSEKHSRTYFQYLIDEHLILVNGSPVKKRTKLQAGDEVEVQFAATPEADLSPEAIPLTIVYEDDHLLVVNKPAGMVVHPAPGNWSGTFVNALLYHCQQLPVPPNTNRPGIVHRLDKDTSGLLIAAKTLEMQQKLIELFASRQVYKEYLAVCIGRPPDGEIQAPIGRHPILRKQMAIVPSGRPAISFCKTLGWNGKLSLVQVVIATGRTHQIRVHLKYKGTPVLGDALYGQNPLNLYYSAPHQLLHAAKLRFQHPVTKEQLEFFAPPPPEMMRFIRRIIPDSSYLQDEKGKKE